MQIFIEAKGTRESIVDFLRFSITQLETDLGKGDIEISVDIKDGTTGKFSLVR